MFGGGSRSSATPSRSAAPSKPAPSNVPAPVQHAPSVPAVSGGVAPRPQGLMGTIMEGMAFGTGSAIAHRAVGAIAGSFGGSSAAQSTENNQAQQNTAPSSVNNSSFASQGQDCNPFQQEFVRCLQENKNDIQMCQMYFDNFQQCQKDNRLQ